LGEQITEGNSVPQNEDASAMIVRLGFDVRVSQQEDRQYDDNHVPAREDQPETAFRGGDSNFLEEVDEYTRKSVGDFTHLEGVIPGRKGDHRGDL
jgi:hypothetical protein